MPERSRALLAAFVALSIVVGGCGDSTRPSGPSLGSDSIESTAPTSAFASNQTSNPTSGSPSPSVATPLRTSPARGPSPAVSKLPITMPAAAVPDGALYVPPDPLPPGAHGDLLRVQRLSAPTGVRAWAILYRSTGLHGQATAVSGIILAPAGPAPAGGRPVVAWAHGTTGLADACSPSHSGYGGVLAAIAGPFLSMGYVVAATDYEGLGTPGPHPYIVGSSEGHAVLDATRAARLLSGTGANDRVVLFGHSQGGHAVLWAAQLAPAYSPELDVVTTVAAAPAGDLASLAEWIQGEASPPSSRLNGLMLASAWHTIFGLPIARFLTPAAVTAAARLQSTCPSSALLSAGQPFLAGATDNPAFRALLDSNTPGSTASSAPILILQGTADEQVPLDSTRVEVQRLCRVGDAVRLDVLTGVGHAGVLAAGALTIGTWIQARMAGAPLTGACGAAP